MPCALSPITPTPSAIWSRIKNCWNAESLPPRRAGPIARPSVCHKITGRIVILGRKGVPPFVTEPQPQQDWHLAAACAAWGQTPDSSLTFEVATIKPSPSPTSMDGGKRMIRIGSQGGPGSSDPGQLTYSFTNVKLLVTQAYLTGNPIK